MGAKNTARMVNTMAPKPRVQAAPMIQLPEAPSASWGIIRNRAMATMQTMKPMRMCLALDLCTLSDMKPPMGPPTIFRPYWLMMP